MRGLYNGIVAGGAFFLGSLVLLSPLLGISGIGPFRLSSNSRVLGQDIPNTVYLVLVPSLALHASLHRIDFPRRRMQSNLTRSLEGDNALFQLINKQGMQGNLTLSVKE